MSLRKRNRIIKKGLGILLLLLPVLLMLLPADYFDNGQVLCPSKRFLDLECMGCGMTRGIQHLIHFQFEEAWAFNKLSFIVFPVIAYLWLAYVLKWIWNIGLSKAILNLFQKPKE